MCTVYGYVRISTKKQSLERQVRNIKAFNSSAVIIEEVFTGTKTYGRKEWCKILKRVKADDTIVFDSVSRMSRNSDDGVKTYFELLDKGVNLIFLKERYIDTDTYKNSMEDAITLRGTDEDLIFIGINNYLRRLAEKQIRIAFEQSEKEVEDLHQRTREGIETARLNGKQIGRITGKKYTSKKEKAAKEIIVRNSKDFNGTNTDPEVIKLAGISRNSYYKYKRELFQET